MAVQEKMANMQARAKKAAKGCHGLFARVVTLGEPDGRFREFRDGVVTTERLLFRPDPVEVTRDPQGQIGVWAVQLTCMRRTTTHTPACIPHARYPYDCTPGEQTIRTRLTLQVFDYADQEARDLLTQLEPSDSSAELEPIGSAQPFDLIQTKLETGEAGRHFALPREALYPDGLEQLYLEQQFCLNWLHCARQQQLQS